MAPFDFIDPDLTIPQIDWMAKRRLNHFAFYVDYYRLDLWEAHKGGILDALLDRGFTIEQSYHSLHYFCPPDENHDFGHHGPGTYRVNHPDWYLPAHEIGRGTWQTRVELPEVRNIITERYLDYFQRNPELNILGLWPDDIPMNQPVPGDRPADGYLPFWNHVADELARAFPGKRVGTIAYFELLRPPARQRPRPNQHLWYCPLERNYQYPLDHDRNRHWIEPLQAWANLSPPGQVGVFEYYGWAVSFIPFRRIVQDDLRIYHDLGVGGIYGWSGFTRDILGRDSRLGIDLAVLSSLLWEPDAPVEQIEDAWIAGMYPGAEAPMHDFYGLLADRHAAEAEKGLAYYFDWIGNYQWIDLDLLHEAQAILAAARNTASDVALPRIDQLEIVCAKGATQSIKRVNDQPDPAYWSVP